jgi:putative FmdB family regulatory protein
MLINNTTPPLKTEKLGYYLSAMPIYEYECQKCSHHFEFLLIPSSPAPECPECRHKKLNKLISLCAVSSENTQQAHLKSARKAAAKVHKEKAHEEHKAIHHHHD